MRGRLYPWVALTILTALYIASFVDRQVLNLLVDPIKHTLGIDEVAFSLLQGLAFMLAFVGFNPIAGRLADRADRRLLLLLAAITWSACTIACGLSSSFAFLFAARFGIGAAEAFVLPAAWSLMADTFSERRLPRALSIFLIGPYIGGGLALIFGGLLIRTTPSLANGIPALAALEPWQIVFVVVGAPGIVLALLTFLLREPRRSRGTARAVAGAELMTVRMALAFLWTARGFFLRFSLAMAGTTISLYSLPAWMPAVLTRSFGADPARVGVELGVIGLVAGTAGVLAGPWVGQLADRGRTGRGIILVPAIAAAGLLLGGTGLLLAHGYHQALVCAMVIAFSYALPQAPAAAALQLASPAGMRGLVASFYAFVIAIVGLVIAPSLVAFFTQYVFGDPAAVRTSLALVILGSAALALWMTLTARRHYQPLGSSDAVASA